MKRSLKNQYELTVQGLNARVRMENPVKVIDPDRHLKLGDPAEENLPLGDSIELFVDVLNNREQVYNYDDRRIGIAPTKDWYRMICVSPTGPFGHNGKCVETEDGYTAEFWLNFWALDYRNRNFPAVIGLDIAIGPSICHAITAWPTCTWTT